MVHLSVIEARLSKLGVRSGPLSRPELRELQNILMDNEEIVALANGRYFAGFATLVATDLRLLIIDKRPFFLTVEDIRYDMISELDYSARLLDATLRIFTVNKQHRFTSFVHRNHLRTLTKYLQQKVMELRQMQQLGAAPSQPQPQFSQSVMPMQLQPASPPAAASQVQVLPQSSQNNYRDMASRLSGRILGPVAVKAVHHHQLLHVPNPYTKASLMVRDGSSWLRSHTPHQPETPAVVAQPEA